MAAEILSAPKTLLTLGLAGAALAFATALVSQYGFGWIPCQLCIWQRYPYGIGAPLAAAALLMWDRPGAEALARGAAGLAALAFAGGAGIALLHTGVEFGWWTGFTACSGGMDLSGSTEDILARIKSAPVVRCDERLSYLFGLSMTNWNLLACLGFAGCFGLAALGGLRSARARLGLA